MGYDKEKRKLKKIMRQCFKELKIYLNAPEEKGKKFYEKERTALKQTMYMVMRESFFLFAYGVNPYERTIIRDEEFKNMGNIWSEEKIDWISLNGFLDPTPKCKNCSGDIFFQFPKINYRFREFTRKTAYYYCKCETDYKVFSYINHPICDAVNKVRSQRTRIKNLIHERNKGSKVLLDVLPEDIVNIISKIMHDMDFYDLNYLIPLVNHFEHKYWHKKSV